MKSPILQAVVPVGDEVLRMDAVEYDGAVWLVPEWLEANDGSHRLPVRMISLATVPHQRVPGGGPAHVAVSEPLPTSLLTGRVPADEAARYVILDYPDIRFAIPK